MYVGKVAAIGKGGSKKKVEEDGEYFVLVYWYFSREEVDKHLKDRYRPLTSPGQMPGSDGVREHEGEVSGVV